MSDTATVKKDKDAKPADTSKKQNLPKTDDGPKTADTGKTKMPGADEFNVTSGPAPANPAAESGDLTSRDPSSNERNDVFGSLVTGDEDIVGLVAYSIYKQNKHDWLVAFNKAKGREPNEEEAASYIVGESTQRRLAIYRHLAQATLDGQGPHVAGTPSPERAARRRAAAAQNTASGESGPTGNKAIGWIIGIAVAVVAIYLAAKYGIPGIQR